LDTAFHNARRKGRKEGRNRELKKKKKKKKKRGGGGGGRRRDNLTTYR
jgi:hypothetical protein